MKAKVSCSHLGAPIPAATVDRFVNAGVWLASSVAVAVLGLIAAYLLWESSPFLEKVGPAKLFFDEDWAPKEGLYGLAPMLASSVLLTAGAVLVATPLSIALAVYCSFYAPRFICTAVLRIVEVSAGIPTVIFGFWGLVVIVPLINTISPPGASILAGVIVLSLMIFPTVAVIVYSSITNVPKAYLIAAAALGVGRAATIRHIVLKHARAGILASMSLGAARAIGETVVVLMVCGNVVQMPTSLFDPVRTLTANIALEMQYAMGMHQSALYATGLTVLIVVTALVLMSNRTAYSAAKG